MTKFQYLMAIATSVFAVVPASAQGVFDLGSLTNSLTINAKPTASPTKTAPISESQLTFTPSPAVRKEAIDGFIAAMSKASPELGAQLGSAFGGADVFAQIDQGLQPFGLKTNNIVDAYTLFLVNAYMASQGSREDNTRAQADGTKAMVLATFSASPEILKLDTRQKQLFADSLVLNAMLYDSMLQATAGNAQATQNIQNEVSTAAKLLGLDLSLFSMTPNGLVRKN
jgi:hypothetical protein